MIRSRVFAAGLLTAAVSTAFAQTPAAPEQITVAITETIAGYNPYGDNVVLMGNLWCGVYGCLTRYNFDTGAFEPFLAESVVAEDPLTWVVTLREGLRRHSGDPVLAEDVAHSIERMRTDPQSMQAVHVAPIDRVEILDARRVRLHTKEPVAALPDYLSQVKVTSKKRFDEHGAAADRTHPDGAGPYRLREVSVGNYVVLERVDGHPMVRESNPKRMIFRMMAEPEQRVTALLNGEVQIAQGVPPQLVERVQRSDKARIESANAVEMMFLAMNPSQAPWDKREVRQAVGHAINREAIVKALLGGQATVLNGPVSQGQYGFDPDYRSPYEYDPAKARALLEQAGALGVSVELFTPVGRYTADRQIAEALTAMLNDAGFDATLQAPEWATLWSNVQRGGVPFYYMGRGQMIDPSRALSQYFETGMSPRLDYSNPDIDALLQAERAEFVPEERVRKLRAAMAALTEDAPAIFLWQHKLAWGVADGVTWTPVPADFVDGWDIDLN